MNAGVHGKRFRRQRVFPMRQDYAGLSFWMICIIVFCPAQFRMELVLT